MLQRREPGGAHERPRARRSGLRAAACVALAAAMWMPGGRLAAATRARRPAPASIDRSVIRVVNYQQRSDWFAPWNSESVAELSGSSFVVAGGLILTNAHVVSDSKMLIAFLPDDPDPHPAEIVHIAHDCDLALIRLKDPKPLEHVAALPLGGLPRLGTAVESFGYPAGGTQVSSTRGVVSRIESQVYVHSGADRHLIGQTDAAINPGNSGGPVVQDGAVVGVAFQAATDLENVGYFIPSEVVGRFFRDIKDGRYDGYPDLGVETSNLDNPAARRKAGMLAGESGVRVDSVRPQTGADGLIRAGDVVLAVDGKTVANDGSVSEDGRRHPFGMLVDRHLVGERSIVRLLRDGLRFDVSIPLSRLAALDLRANAYDRRPRYYIFAGLVFVPLELETMKTFGPEWFTQADKPMLHEFLYRIDGEPARLNDERVVLLRRLDDPVNASIAWFKNVVVERVNGRDIRDLDALIDAIATGTDPEIVIEYSNYRRIAVLDRDKATRANEQILRRYGIDRDRHL